MLQPEPSTNTWCHPGRLHNWERGHKGIVCLRECVCKTKTPHLSENRSGPWRLWGEVVGWRTDGRPGARMGKRQLKDEGWGDSFCWRKQTKERSFCFQNKNTRCYGSKVSMFANFTVLFPPFCLSSLGLVSTAAHSFCCLQRAEPAQVFLSRTLSTTASPRFQVKA